MWNQSFIIKINSCNYLVICTNIDINCHDKAFEVMHPKNDARKIFKKKEKEFERLKDTM